MTELNLSMAYPDGYPVPPIYITGGVTITDHPRKFVERTVAELQSYVAARNAGRGHWLGESFLVDEKIEQLRACGVACEITGDDPSRVEPELPALNIPPPNWDFVPKKPKPIEKFNVGFSDAEVKVFFRAIGIEFTDQTDPRYWQYDPARLRRAWAAVGINIDEDRVASHIANLKSAK